MKNKNPGNLDRRLSILLLVVMAGCNNVRTGEDAVAVNTTQTASETIVFDGTLLQVGPDVGLTSGRFAVYRVAKYRVERVCEGKYDGSEIVVDHLVLNGKEFENINVGDRVCVMVKMSRRILVRYDAEGIRSSSDVVDVFYIAADKIKALAGRSSCCEAQ